MSSTSFCDTNATLSTAIEAISDASYIFFDCEGTQLGSQGGLLSTIAIGLFTADNDVKAFVVDAIALKDSLQPLFAVLSADKPVKVMWDGRRDSSELYHRFGITLGGVLDMQLADIISREIRGEDEPTQFRRHDGVVEAADLRASPQYYRQVQRLNNLNKCAVEHAIEVPATEPSFGSYHTL